MEMRKTFRKLLGKIQYSTNMDLMRFVLSKSDPDQCQDGRSWAPAATAWIRDENKTTVARGPL